MVVIGTVICCTNPVLAKKIPVLGRIFQEVQQEVRFSGGYSDDAEILDVEEKSTTAEDAGVTFTASEIYSDGMSIYLTAEVVVAQGGLDNIPSNTMYLQGGPEAGRR